MPGRVRISLRKRWRPPPGWPPAPRGYIPPEGWRPDPAWPPAPEGWKYWRPHRARLVAALILSVWAVVAVSGNFDDQNSLHRYHALASRGVTTTAQVIESHYDENGGDPGGWTTDTVRFRTDSGTVVQTVVGHHDSDSSERTSGRIEIVYDPQRPTVAVTRMQFDGGSTFPDLLVGLFVSAASIVAALVIAFFAVEIRRQPPRTLADQATAGT